MRIQPGDVVLALGLLAFALAELVAIPELPRRVAVPAAVAMTTPLLWRRRAPVAVVGIVFGAFALQIVWGVPDDAQLAPTAAVLAASFSVGAYAERQRAIGGLALALLLAGMSVPVDPAATVSDFGFVVLVVGASWGAGRLVYARGSEARAQQLRAEHLAAAGEQRVRQAIEVERRRIARELHDIVAHSLSLIVVQAGGAEQVVRSDPAGAATSLSTIQEIGRQSLVEMKRLLGVLRAPSDRDALHPLPGLDNLGTLVDQVRAAGVPAELTIEGTPRRGGDGVELSAFRVVQEALTNVMKHSRRVTHVGVLVRYTDEDVCLDIVDDGTADAPSRANGSGAGLAGLRERADLFGGHLEAGPRPGGGFQVQARFPLGTEPR